MPDIMVDITTSVTPELTEALTYNIRGGKLAGRTIQRCLLHNAKDLFKYTTPKVKGCLGVIATYADELDTRVTYALIEQMESGDLSIDKIPHGLLERLKSLTVQMRDDDRLGITLSGDDVSQLTDYQRQERQRARLNTETQMEWLQRMKDLKIVPQSETITTWTPEERKEYASYILTDELEERKLIFRILDGNIRSKHGYKAVLGPARHTKGQDTQQQHMVDRIKEISGDARMQAFKKRVIRHDPDNCRPDDTDDVPGAI